MLCCSAGHLYDQKNLQHVWWRGERIEGGNCPEVMAYDRMFGTTKCNRKLFDLDKRIEKLYERIFTKRYGGDDKIFSTHCWEELPHGSEKIKEVIKEFILNHKEVKTGWSATSVRGHHNYLIFYKKQ